jgi:hypothetical protein
VGEDTTLDTGQDNGTLRVTIREAAARLGVTEAAVRKRIQRGSLGREMGQDGRVYVYLDLSQDMSQPESQAPRDPLVEELIEELRDRVAFLERSLEQRSVEAERYQQIVAGLTQTNNQLATRLRELEAPESPESEASHVPSDAPTDAGGEAQEPSERPDSEAPRQGRQGRQVPWWRRMFGG